MTYHTYMRRPPPGSLDMAAATTAALKSFGVNDAHAKAWAYRLKAAEEAGETVLPIQRRLWREALGEPAEAKGQADSVPRVVTEVF